MPISLQRIAPDVAALIVAAFALAPALAADPAPKKPLVKILKKTPPPAAPTIPDAQPEQVKAAELVYYGSYECEFQQSVSVVQSPKHSSYVDVVLGKQSWLMKPVLSSTGAVRLEDVRGETLMVQIASKSMLLNVKTAHRLVDDCVSPKQRELIAEAKATKAAAEAAPVKASEQAGTAAAPATTPLLK
ncbi:MAG TPA: hypothetical protein VGK95_01170 [Caldimonas sp.]|jgi:hypothetical protein